MKKQHVTISKKAGKPKPRRFTLKDLKKYSFPGGPKDLSQRIDEILYGSKNSK